ncbi:MAG: PP0621 family protein [Achromobacter sp.]
MGKLLFWVVLIIAVLFVARIAARMAAAKQAGAQNTARRRQPAPAAPESMVRCAHCGIHLPRSEAVLQNGLTWCSTEHARLGPAKK